MSNKILSLFGGGLSPHAEAALAGVLRFADGPLPFAEDIGRLNFLTRAPVFAAALNRFCESIKVHGFLSPVIISPEDNSVLDGIKRCRAAAVLGIEKIPCVYAGSGFKSVDGSLTELIKTKTLHFFDEAIIINTLVSGYLYTQDCLASLLDVSQSYVANKLRLLKFGEDERESIRAFSLSERTARTLLRIPEIRLRAETAEVIFNNSLSVSAAEKYIDCLVSHNSSRFDSRAAQRTAKSIERLIDASIAEGESIAVNRQEDDYFIKLNIVISKGFT